jgi:hypothetical protein
MLQLIYISTAQSAAGSDLDKILLASRRNNGRDDITGMLLFNGKRFLQALEGPEALVLATYDRITLDQRHRAPVILSSKPIADRQFGAWAMACERRARQAVGRSLVETVDSLVAGVSDPNVRALFSSYVRMDVAA